MRFFDAGGHKTLPCEGKKSGKKGYLIDKDAYARERNSFLIDIGAYARRRTVI